MLAGYFVTLIDRTAVFVVTPSIIGGAAHGPLLRRVGDQVAEADMTAFKDRMSDLAASIPLIKRRTCK